VVQESFPRHARATPLPGMHEVVMSIYPAASLELA
jgi:hypothetical protein